MGYFFFFLVIERKETNLREIQTFPVALSSWQAVFSCQYKVNDVIADIFIFFETALEGLDKNLCSPGCVGNRAG